MPRNPCPLPQSRWDDIRNFSSEIQLDPIITINTCEVNHYCYVIFESRTKSLTFIIESANMRTIIIKICLKIINRRSEFFALRKQLVSTVNKKEGLQETANHLVDPYVRTLKGSPEIDRRAIILKERFFLSDREPFWISFENPIFRIH
jgi:hypothetical protein